MTNLLEQLVLYISSHTDMIPGEAVFYNDMPDEPATCIAVQEQNSSAYVPPQVNAEVHAIKVVVRDVNNTNALVLAQRCWRWMLTDLEQYDTDKEVDTTGFITLPDTSCIQVKLFGSPFWEKADQQGRKYFCFYAQIITSR